MRTPRLGAEPGSSRGLVRAVGLLAVLSLGWGGAGSRADETDWREVRRGRELFLREWRVGDSRSHGGDGLGPLSNANSCVACHGLGGAGGAGPASTNVDLLNLAPFPNIQYQLALDDGSPGPQGRSGAHAARRKTVTRDLTRAEVISRIHPGLRETPSVVLHHSGTDTRYAPWREGLLALRLDAVRGQRFGQTAGPAAAALSPDGHPDLSDAELIRQLRERRMATVTQRNPTPLFGVGLIDAISDEAIVQAAGESTSRSPNAHGRVHRLKGGGVGKFGWKAQVGSLQEFVLTACANELGLENPGHHQAASPFDPDAVARKPDLTGAECDALVAYVRDLPAPAVLDLGTEIAPEIAAGRKLFDSVGCANCHRPSLGGVDGIYSDMLLHDMGSTLSDSGQYYGADDSGSSGGPSSSEWRTPPLWGLRDSAPYLHDGRASDLPAAIAAHGGEARDSTQRFTALSPTDKYRVESFLLALAAPAGPRELARRGAIARDEWALGRADAEARAAELELRRVEAEARARAQSEAQRVTEAVRRTESRFEIAQKTEVNGHLKGAISLYREVIQLYPDTPAAERARARIDELKKLVD